MRSASFVRSPSQAGGTLLYIIFLLIFMATLAGGVMTIGKMSAISETRSNALHKAMFLADAGLNYALGVKKTFEDGGTRTQADYLLELGTNKAYTVAGNDRFVLTAGSNAVTGLVEIRSLGVAASGTAAEARFERVLTVTYAASGGPVLAAHFDSNLNDTETKSDGTTSVRRVGVEKGGIVDTAYVDGIKGKALKLDGMLDRVTFYPHSGTPANSQSGTVMCWAKMNMYWPYTFLVYRGLLAPGVSGGDVSSDAIFSLQFKGSILLWDDTRKVVYFDTFGPSGADSQVSVNSMATPSSPPSFHGKIEEGNWYHIAATWSPANGSRLYINGHLNNSDPAYSQPRNVNAPIVVGNYTDRDTWTPDFNGLIDEVFVWQRELPQAEVKQMYCHGEQTPTQSNGDLWPCIARKGMNIVGYTPSYCKDICQ